MKWMDIDIIYNVILNTRKSTFGKEDSIYIKQNIHEGLIVIKKLRDDCLSKILCKKIDNIENLEVILQTESKIINIIGILSYSEFDKDTNLKNYMDRESKYVLKDYIDSLEYYAEDYRDFGLLPHFYIKELNNFRFS
ncbi:Uncharacterised protein [Enterococcus hirae]|uniref:hypothetical protein n=1 Tax=Enterococcus hirae TaxID=1354 RepID=UPI001026A968|nr:hypothetical protein [Enterococcus hirae]VFA55598.1 Uncharacterised protein [Enterococcus hirae]VTS69271.1 Uncharacterised protein [Enterococcus hirae]VTS75974.1 Uncharacterised protein [Enterococcus hirae]